MLGFIIFLLVVGAIAGFLARLIVPGRDPMGVVATIVLGIIGSFIGGFLGYILFHKDADEGAFRPRASSAPFFAPSSRFLIYRAINRRTVGAR